jgi:hypothetical protein
VIAACGAGPGRLSTTDPAAKPLCSRSPLPASMSLKCDTELTDWLFTCEFAID